MGIVLCVYVAFIPIIRELPKFNICSAGIRAPIALGAVQLARRTTHWMRLMSLSALLAPEVVLRNYFHAKDENRPYLLDRVFTSDASLHINNSCSNITFPTVAQGRGAIADTLVTQFNKTYENIYSFYLACPPEAADSFSCAWLVGMTEKDTKNTRVGCGTYDWTFSSEAPRLASALVISIHAMVVLPPSTASVVFPWLQRAGYPWPSAAQACGLAPPLAELDPVVQHLKRYAIGA